ICAGSHSGDVCGHQNEESGRAGAAATRTDVEDDRNLRGGNLFDNVAGGIDESARSVQLDEKSLVVAAPGFVNSSGNVFLGDGLDRVIDDDLENLGVGGGKEKRQTDEESGGANDKGSLHEFGNRAGCGLRHA